MRAHEHDRAMLIVVMVMIMVFAVLRCIREEGVGIRLHGGQDERLPGAIRTDAETADHAEAGIQPVRRPGSNR